MPMRTPLTPSASTATWRRAVAITVLGRSSRMRAGCCSVLTCGFTAPRVVTSRLNPSLPRATFTFCSVAGATESVPVFCVSAAAAMSTIISSGTKTLSSCLRISLLPVGLKFCKPVIFLLCRNLSAYTAGVVIFLVTSRWNDLPSLSCMFCLKTIESPVIFTTYPLNTGSFWRRK